LARRRRQGILPPSYLGLTSANAERLTTIVSTKGQVILRKSIRDQFHWNAGTRLIVQNTEDGVLLKSAPGVCPNRDRRCLWLFGP